MIRWVYTGRGGGLARKLLFRTSLPSRLLGAFCNSSLSRGRIAPFARRYGIALDDAAVPVGGFRTFNEFFRRRLRPEARPFAAAPDVLVSPADCRALVFADGCAGEFAVKGLGFSIAGLLRTPQQEKARCTDLDGGQVAVFRLCPMDYHRFHFPAAGRKLAAWRVDGAYGSVNPLPLRLGIKVFEENVRQVTLLELERFGRCAMVEVGAFGVARIVQTHVGEEVAKMDEKGYFEFGGSTVVLILPPGSVDFSGPLRSWSEKGIETLLKAGDTLGTCRRRQ